MAIIRELAEVARDPAAIAARIEALKATPREAVEQAETLAEFIRREGGISEEAVAAAGIDPATIARQFPELVKRTGKDIHDLSEAAMKAGYFAGLPTPARLAEALADEVTQGRPTVRASAAGTAPGAAENARTVSALRRAGIDIEALEPAQAAARLRTLAERIEQVSRDTSPTAMPERRIDPEGARLAEARTQQAEVSTAAEREAELDEIREAQLREDFAGHENERIMVEDEDGTVRPMTFREILEADAREADEIEAIHFCVAGGVRNSSGGIVRAVKKVFGG